MRIAIVLAALVATVAAIPTPHKQQAADQEFLKKQNEIFYLFEQIGQPIPNQVCYQLGQSYDIENHLQDYQEPEVVKYYLTLYHFGDVQPQGTPFSFSVSHLRKELGLVTRILIGAKNYDVFMKTAAYMRVHINEEQYVHALIAAILVRKDTSGIVPPALYEIFPQHYFDSRVIQYANHVYNYGVNNAVSQQTVVIPVNYTDDVSYGEHYLKYFTHDIGLSVYYAYFSLAGQIMPELVYPHVSHTEQSQQHIGRGSSYYYVHQQLLAYYTLARLSHHLQPIEDIDYENPEVYYKPHLNHINGLPYPGRDQNVNFNHKYELVRQVYAFETRLREAIDSGAVLTPQQKFLSLYQPQGLNILGELIEGVGKSVNPRYYGSLSLAARNLVGNVPEFNSIYDYTPSVLDLHESAVRDPAFYQLYHRIMQLFHAYHDSLPAYQYNDVALPGVKIEEVVFPQLYTYYEQYLVNIDNVVPHQYQQGQMDNVHVKAEVPRLNHKQYEYKIMVNAQQPVENAVVRVYLGPKYGYDGKMVDINEHHYNFVELDQFVYNLQQGKNVIIRDSEHAPHLSYDYPTIHHMKADIESALSSKNPYYVQAPHQIFGFPARLSIPKGQQSGSPYQIFVVIHAAQPVNFAYNPIVPVDYQYYHQANYHVVSEQQYPQAVQEQYEGVYSVVDVMPEYYQPEYYSQDIEQLKHYYGHYLYKQYHYVPEFQYHGYQYGGQYPGQASQVVYPHQIPVTSYTQGSVPQVPYVPHQNVYTSQQQQPSVAGQVYQQGPKVPQVPQVPYAYQGVQNVEAYDHYKHNAEYLQQYYQNQPISHMIGGAVSLDNKPLGWPLDRHLASSVLYAPNVYMTETVVYHEDVIVQQHVH